MENNNNEKSKKNGIGKQEDFGTESDFFNKNKSLFDKISVNYLLNICLVSKFKI